MPPRRALHQPIFPIYTSSPSPQPSPAPSFPKHPSSFSSHSTPTTTTTTTNNLPFFPLYPSPPPPPPSPSLPTFPANISTLSTTTTTSSHSIPPSKLIIFISLPILCLLFLFLSAALFLLILRRNIRSSTNDFDTEPASDNHRLVPPNSTASDKPPATPSQHNSSEFLYLGTLVNSRGHVASSHASGEVGPTIAAGSPELRPLPPLSRQSRRSFESDEEFYSPPPYSKAPPPPPPPPPPAMTAGRLKPPVLPPPKLHQDSSLRQDSERRPRLKALHWDKVRASSDRTMVWDHLRSSSFQLNEEMMETLFGCDVNGGKGREVGDVKRKVDLGTTAVAAAARSEEMVLNLKKAQNIAILLRALNVTTEEVCEAILEGSTDSLGNELLETLLRMAPSKEEEIKLREYKDNSSYKLGPAEKFLKAMLDIPFAFKRVDAMLYITNFDAEIKYLTKSFETLEVACEELRNSRLFRKLLDAVLKTGNRMNVGTNRGDAQAFKLDTLLKLVDIKGTDGKTTLLHFVVQEISRTEGFRQTTTNPQSNSLHDNLECKRLGLSVVSRLGAELSNVKKAATMDSDVLSGYVSKLAGGITRVRELVRLNEITDSFHESMTRFLKMAEGEISKLQNQEGVALSLVKEITEYFHGDSAKEEAHPLRIFMVVKDFLMTLDQVCKDVGRVNERSVVSSMRQFPVPASVGNPPVFPQIHGVQPGSSDDESSSLSSFSS